MRFARAFLVFSCAGLKLFLGSSPGQAQDSAGPFVPHSGLQITTAFTNEFGRDAEATTTVEAVSSDRVNVAYSSTRGLGVSRDILIKDRKDARMYVLGYAKRMPKLIEGSTSMGISQAVLQDLRRTGGAVLTLIYSDQLDRIDCQLSTKGVDIKVPVMFQNDVIQVQAIQAAAVCGSGGKTGNGQLVFANDLANPILIDSFLSFSWEDRPRTERVVRVAAGAGLSSEMAQALGAFKAFDVYGWRFDFDSAELRPETKKIVNEIAATLQANPKWVVQILGHTDSTGGEAYNKELSQKRAEAIRSALIADGVAPARLEAVGLGMSKPKADNATLAGRAINRRVEFRRLDR